MKKLKNECQFCKSRFCHTQIYRDEAPLYDEVFCDKHIQQGQDEADKVLGARGSGVFRWHRSSTGNISRGSR